MSPRLAVLASGIGSLFEAIIDHGIPMHLLVTDRKCPALGISKERGILHVMLPRVFTKDFDREAFTEEMAMVLCAHSIELVAMAGFRTVFTPTIFCSFQRQILNIHPSLLPAFPGCNAVMDALDYGVKITGCTVHWATEDLDSGSILQQEAVPVHLTDTEKILHERIKIKKVERRIYPRLLASMTT
jgi:phosphoribosylglycinamide formyltransferase-1